MLMNGQGLVPDHQYIGGRLKAYFTFELKSMETRYWRVLNRPAVTSTEC